MNFEWDEKKRAQNLEKHGIDFVDCVKLFEENAEVLTFPSSFKNEPRYLTIGDIDLDAHVTVVWTMREDRIRIISARSSRREERKRHGEIYD